MSKLELGRFLSGFAQTETGVLQGQQQADQDNQARAQEYANQVLQQQQLGQQGEQQDRLRQQQSVGDYLRLMPSLTPESQQSVFQSAVAPLLQGLGSFKSAYGPDFVQGRLPAAPAKGRDYFQGYRQAAPAAAAPAPTAPSGPAAPLAGLTLANPNDEAAYGTLLQNAHGHLQNALAGGDADTAQRLQTFETKLQRRPPGYTPDLATRELNTIVGGMQAKNSPVNVRTAGAKSADELQKQIDSGSITAAGAKQARALVGRLRGDTSSPAGLALVQAAQEELKQFNQGDWFQPPATVQQATANAKSLENTRLTQAEQSWLGKIGTKGQSAADAALNAGRYYRWAAENGRPIDAALNPDPVGDETADEAKARQLEAVKPLLQKDSDASAGLDKARAGALWGALKDKNLNPKSVPVILGKLDTLYQEAGLPALGLAESGIDFSSTSPDIKARMTVAAQRLALAKTREARLTADAGKRLDMEQQRLTAYLNRNTGAMSAADRQAFAGLKAEVGHAWGEYRNFAQNQLNAISLQGFDPATSEPKNPIQTTAKGIYARYQEKKRAFDAFQPDGGASIAPAGPGAAPSGVRGIQRRGSVPTLPLAGSGPQPTAAEYRAEMKARHVPDARIEAAIRANGYR